MRTPCDALRAQAERVADLGVGVVLRDAGRLFRSTAADAAASGLVSPPAAQHGAAAADALPAGTGDREVSGGSACGGLATLLPPLLRAVMRPAVRSTCLALARQLEQEGSGLPAGIATMRRLLSSAAPQKLPASLFELLPHKSAARCDGAGALCGSGLHTHPHPDTRGKQDVLLADKKKYCQEAQRLPAGEKDPTAGEVEPSQDNQSEASQEIDYSWIHLAASVQVATACEREARFIYNEIFTDRCYSHPRGRLHPPTALDPCGVILDVGANIGLFALSVLLGSCGGGGDECCSTITPHSVEEHEAADVDVASEGREFVTQGVHSNQFVMQGAHSNKSGNAGGSDRVGGGMPQGGGRVYAIEPLPPNLRLLQLNLASHGFGEGSEEVTVVPLALGSAEGTSTFTYYPNCPGNSTVTILSCAFCSPCVLCAVSIHVAAALAGSPVRFDVFAGREPWKHAS